MRYFIIAACIMAISTSFAFGAGAETYTKIGTTKNINVFFNENEKNFSAQYRSIEFKGAEIVVSIMFINMSSSVSPDIRNKQGKHTRIKIETYYKNNNTVVASKSIYPIDYYYQQEGYVRTGNSIPLYLHSGNLDKKQLDSVNGIYINPILETY